MSKNWNVDGITIHGAHLKYGVPELTLSKAWKSGAIRGRRLGSGNRSPVLLNESDTKRFCELVPQRGRAVSQISYEKISDGAEVFVGRSRRKGTLEKLGEVYFVRINDKRYRLEESALDDLGR